MLRELRVSHFAIIQNLKISFEEGLNILSGETGAGKSVLLKSLGLLMGEKATTDLVSDNAETASVEGLFDLSERADIVERLKSLDLHTQGEDLIVRRVIAKEGSSRVYINGSLSTLQTLRDLVFPLVELTRESAPLIEMTGQHESKNLMSRHYHLDVLDRFCEATALRAEYESAHRAWTDLKERFESLRESSQDRDQKLDYLKFQFEQIDSLNLQENEDEEIVQELQQLKAIAKVQGLAQASDQVLIQDDGSAQERLRKVARLCLDFSKTNPIGTQWAETLSALSEQLEECVFQIQNYSSSADGGVERISELEERLSDIRSLQKRYGPSIADIIAQREKIKEEIEALTSLEEQLQRFEKDEKKILLTLKDLGSRLSTLRSSGAKSLQEALNRELADLNMKGVSTLVSVVHQKSPSATGYDEVELFLKSSAKSEPRALRKVASGGELSRVLLALKCVGGDIESPRTFLFDEVDAGVSGVTAQKVGKKLRAIAKGQQVICITHLPQVAAFADHHYHIQKSVKGGLATMAVRCLTKAERAQEIARLLSGESVTQAALKNARELLAST